MLSHHLGWVPTVVPTSETADEQLSKSTPGSLSTLSRFHPYDPLWAQLCDLYGAIGTPAALCRTVVVGRKAPLVERLLLVLTYFIRSNEVMFRWFGGCWEPGVLAHPPPRNSLLPNLAGL